MIEIVVNGEPTQIKAEMNVTEFLTLFFSDERVAVARNGEFVPRSAFDEVVLVAGDALEILSPVQGG